MPDFRITVHMHNFFEDHRSSCRLFVTAKMKTILDLKEHISKILELPKDFYLTSSNLYLPELEDIRVLSEDDVVAVIPAASETDLGFPTDSTRKQRKRGRNAVNSELENCISQEFEGVKKKKKRKDLEIATDDQTYFQKKEKKSNKSKSKLPTSPCNADKEKQNHVEKGPIELCPANQSESDDSSVETKTENHVKENVKKNSDVNLGSCRHALIVPRKNIKLMEVSKIPKVVKSIIVQDRPAVFNANDFTANNSATWNTPTNIATNHKENVDVNHIVNESNNSWTFDKELVYKSKIVNIPQQEMPKICFKNESKQVNGPVNQNEVRESHPNPATNKGSAIENAIVSFLAESASKQEEHINTNKNLNIISVETVASAQNLIADKQLQKNETIGPQLIPVTSEVQNSVSEMDCEASFDDHSESLASTFTEESGMDLTGSSETKRKRKRVRKRKPKGKQQESEFEAPVVIARPVFTQAAPVMHIRFDEENKDVDIEDNNVDDVVTNGSIASKDVTEVIDINVNYDKLTNEEVLQYPVMKEKLPKEGDTIAFKICRLSECYTPEISNIIIAKVLSYCPSTDNVDVKVLEGADECSPPEGKFYMESCDNGEEEETEERSFLWKDLIEPRLLFP